MFHDPQLLLQFRVTKKLEDHPLSTVRYLFLYNRVCPACVVCAVAVSDILGRGSYLDVGGEELTGSWIIRTFLIWIRLHPMSRVRMNGAVLPLPHCMTSWRGQWQHETVSIICGVRGPSLSLKFSDLAVSCTGMKNIVQFFFWISCRNPLLTHSTVQSPSWVANWFAAGQEIPRISRNPKVRYRTHKRPPPVSILGHPIPVHIPTSHLLEMCPNIIHPSTPRSPQWSLSVTHYCTKQTQSPTDTQHSPMKSVRTIQKRYEFCQKYDLSNGLVA